MFQGYSSGWFRSVEYYLNQDEMNPLKASFQISNLEYNPSYWQDVNMELWDWSLRSGGNVHSLCTWSEETLQENTKPFSQTTSNFLWGLMKFKRFEELNSCLFIYWLETDNRKLTNNTKTTVKVY